MKDFEKWWATEPFGYDNPNTYNGIKKLLDDKQKIIDRAVETIERYSKLDYGPFYCGKEAREFMKWYEGEK